MAENDTNRFDQEAEGWDEKPGRLLMASSIADRLLSEIPMNQDMTALEFGCGTGLITMQLIGRLNSITAADTAIKMLEVVEKKALAQNISSISTFTIDPETGSLPEGKFDLIFSNMVMHHVNEYKKILTDLFDHLEEGGYIAISDLDKEEGDFHEDMTDTFHTGFVREELIQFMSDVGYKDFRDYTAHTMTREREGGTKDFPIFMIIGRR